MPKYPKSNGREWDRQRKEDFDSWKHEFYDCIRISHPELGDEATETIAWNCAFLVVTDRHTA